MVPDPAVVWTGHGAQLGAAVLGLERLHQFGAVRQQAVLHVDAGERRGKLTQIARRRPDQAAELTEGPVSRRHGLVAARHDQRQPLGIVAARLAPNVAGLDGAGGRASGQASWGAGWCRYVALVGAPGTL